jgi:hypothetical protein
LFQQPGSHCLAFLWAEPPIFIGIELFSYLCTFAKVSLAAAVHCLVGLDAFLIIEFAIAIGIKLGYDLWRVSRSFT